MIADLKADSARWEQERRNHSGGTNTSRESSEFFTRRSKSNSPPARYSDSQNRFSGASSQYDTSGAPYPSGSKRDSYACVPRYPGSDAPGYSAASVGSTYPDNRQSGYGGQYPAQPSFPPQTTDNRFATPGPASAGVYGAQQPYPSHPTNAQVPDTPYIGGHYMQSRQPEYQDPRMVDASSSRAYNAPGSYGSQGQAYYSTAHPQGAYPAPSGDPFLGRQSYPATTQAEYVGSPTGQPIYQEQYEPQYENQTSPPPRSVAPTSSSTQAQTGNSGQSHTRRTDRERERETADRHRRR